MSHLFCFGLGYSARRFAAALRARPEEGWQVSGTSRSAGTLAALRGEGFSAHPFDRSSGLAEPEAALAGVTHLLTSIAPDDMGDPVLDTSVGNLARLADSGTLQWIGYLSTTGVYGDHNGGWVDEAAPLRPSQERTKRRVEAERRWLAFGERHGAVVQVFRLAGIYGPGRSIIDDLRAGTARRVSAPPGHAFSRIHVADIAGVLEAALARPRAGGIYNVADDHPCPSAEVVEEACRLLGVPPPPLEPLRLETLSPMARSFYADNRRIVNDRIKLELGYKLRCPTYREGLRLILAEERMAALR